MNYIQDKEGGLGSFIRWVMCCDCKGALITTGGLNREGGSTLSPNFIALMSLTVYDSFFFKKKKLFCFFF